MSKIICLVAAGAVSLATLSSAQAQPRPRFSTRLPAAVQPAADAAPVFVPVQTQPTAAPEPEAPRAAPVGAVQATELPILTQPAPAPVRQEPAPLAAPPLQPIGPRLTHTVGAGDTFYAIGRRYGVGPQALADANGLALSATLRLGQQLVLPAGALDRGAEAAFPAVRRLSPPAVAADASIAPPVQPTPTFQPAPSEPPPPTTPPTQPPLQRPAAEPAPTFTPSPQTPAGPSTVQLGWPLQGEMLAPFGPTGVGQRNDGIRIAAAEGTSVRAAAPGRVVYAGDQVKGGYGKLVLVEHDGRWFTAYAHLSEIRVRMQDRVQEGQELGLVGRTGSVAAPQLYFEVRHAPTAADRARPVDPLPLLRK